MLSIQQQKLLKLNLINFPILAAASAAINKCPKCSHNNINKSTILRAAILRVRNKPDFIQFIHKNFKCPVHLGGQTIQ